MPSTTVRWLGLLLMIAALSPTRLPAQSDPRLVAAVREAREGQSDSARGTVQRLLARTPATDTLYPQILYTAAVIAPDAATMRRHLQRVVVEFSASSWTDDALLRLAQLDYATHQLDGAARHLERMALDFPASPLLSQAAYWAAQTYFDLKQNDAACRWLASGLARTGDDVELQTQLRYLHQRCGIAPIANADTGAKIRPPASTPRPDSTRPPAQPAPARERFRVQIAAVSTADAADAAARKVQALGYPTVTIRDGALYKVRAGDFSTRADAQQASAFLKDKLGGTPFVVSE